jgi:GntR family transcriptional repressor for pyruvate dehydrogenase complex
MISQRQQESAPGVVEGQPGLSGRVRDAVVFSPLSDAGLVEQAVRRLGEAIGLGLLAVGERLPPEPELARQLGIAPMTLRQALAILREAGYVETRRGRGGGTFVRRARPPAPRRRARRLLAGITVDDLQDLVDFRAAIAAAATALATERALQDELAAMRSLVEAMDAPASYQAFRRDDARFHLAVAAAARSPRLTAAEASMQVEVGALMSLIPHPPEALHVSNAQHRAILEAMSRRRPEAARALMEEHVRGTGDFLVGLRLGMVGP